MWTAVSGAAAQMHSVETVANNLANSETLAFKKDAPTFKEYLANVERNHDPQDIPRGPIKDKDFYPVDGKDQSFVINDGTYTNFKQGPLRVTHGQLDLALEGPGFLEVSTPQGARFTRVGALKMDAQGKLVTSEGYPVMATQPLGVAGQSPVLGANNPNLPLANRTPAGIDQARIINLRDRGAHFSISESGELYAGEELVARLSVVEFQDVNKLRKQGSQLFENSDSTNAKPSQKTVIRQGVLEMSNVNPIEEMTNLIRANRMYEQDLKAIKTYGELLGREVNDIGKL